MPSPTAVSPSTVLFGVAGGTKAVFFRQLATMIQSGLPVGRAVKTSGEVGLKKLATEVAALVDNGKSLSEAMAQFPYHFSRHEVALVKAGENSGMLDRQLNELAKTAEMSWQLQKKITSKMVYPIMVAHSVVVLPPLFLLVKSGIKAYLYAVLGMLIPSYLFFGGGFFIYRFFRQAGGPRRFMDHVLSRIPFIGDPIRSGAKIRFLQTLANLIEAGFIPGQAIPLAADSCDNFWLRDKVVDAYNKLGREIPVSQMMEESKAFGAFELGLIMSGEESGTFAQSLKKASETLRPDYEAQVHRLTVILPVLLLFVVGGLVGVVALNTLKGIFAPIMDII